MTKANFLRAMYQAILDENPTDSKLDPCELSVKLDGLFDKYLPKEDLKTRNAGETDFIAIVYDYIENAFNVGFDTAIKLFMGSSAI